MGRRRPPILALAAGLAAATVPPVTSAQFAQTTLQRSPPAPIRTYSLAQDTLVGAGLILGRVVEAGSGRPVAGATVSLAGSVRMPAGFSRPQPAPGTPAPVPQPLPQILTDSEGRFAFRHLPPGSFTLQVQKAGHAPGAYGRYRPNGPMQQLTLDEGERAGDVVLRLFRLSAIEGLVLDEFGEPVVGVEIRAYRRSLMAGRRTLSAAGAWGAARTDDRGMYRIAGLAPGEYVIVAPTMAQSVPADFRPQDGTPPDLQATIARPGASWSIGGGGVRVTRDGRFLLRPVGTVEPAPALAPDGRLLVFPTTYHPAAPTASGAMPIAVEAGEDRSAVDIVLRRVPAVAVSGRLVGPDGPAEHYALHLVPNDTGEPSADPHVATAITNTAGEFMFLGVPAGRYVIQTVRAPRPGVPPAPPPPPPPPGAAGGVVGGLVGGVAGRGAATPASAPAEPLLWAAAPVSVADADVGGLLLALREGHTVSGRVEFAGSREPPPPERLATIPIVVEPADGRLRAPAQPSRLDRLNRFTSAGVLPGEYLVRVGGAPPGWYLRSAMLNGVDVSDTPVTVDRDVSNIVITFTDQVSRVRGVVRGRDGAPDGDAAVIIFPGASAGWTDYGINPRRVRMVRPASATAEFTLSGLPAGDYFVVAVPDEYSGEWQDPQYLEALSRVAQRVSLTEGSERTVDLRTEAVPPPGGRFEPAAAGPADPVPAAADGGHGPFVPDRGQAQAPPRDARAAASAGAGVITGVVLNDLTGQPVRGARVSLRGGEAPVEFAVMTDDEGRFVLQDLPQGRFTLSASKPSYLTGYYGSTRIGRTSPQATSLDAGEAVTGAVIRIAPGAVITGAVVDEFGAPVPNVGVRLLQSRRVNGEDTLVSAASQGPPRTDDRGVYRLYGLQPGRYLVLVTPPPIDSSAEVRQLTPQELAAAAAEAASPPPAASLSPAAAGRRTMPGIAAPPIAAPGSGAGGGPPGPAPPEGRSVVFAPVYYPGTPFASQASSLTIAAGQQIAGVDIPLRRVPSARVEGTVRTATGQPPGNVQMTLATEQPGLGVLSLAVRVQGDRFWALSVPPGRYVLDARARPAPPAPPPPPTPAGGISPLPPAGTGSVTLLGWAELDVNGVDLTGLTLTLSEGLSLSGQVVFSGSTPPPDLSRVQVSLVPVGVRRTSASVVRPRPDGTFTLAGLVPGAYRVASAATVPAAPGAPGWTLHSARFDGRDALDVPLELREGGPAAGLIVTYADRRSELSGTLTDAAGRPVTDLMVFVFPADRTYWASSGRRRPAPVRPDDAGRYRLTGLPAGDYHLAAVRDVEPEDWGDPAFLEQVVPAAIRITLGEFEVKAQDIRVAGRDAPVRALPPRAR